METPSDQPITLLDGVRVYLMGPMTGYEEFNRPAFRYATAVLRERGVKVTSPDELDSMVPAAGTDWADYMRRDLPWVVQAEAGVALPGWKQSRGAMLEASVLNSLGLPVYELNLDSRLLVRVPPEQLPIPLIPS